METLKVLSQAYAFSWEWRALAPFFPGKDVYLPGRRGQPNDRMIQ